MQATPIIWRRFGKEHGEGQGFRLNPPDVVHQHLQAKADACRATTPAAWRWWQVSDELLVEQRPDVPEYIYYLPQRRWALCHHLPTFRIGDAVWQWYIHLADTCYDERYGSWVMTDLFVDVLVHADGRTHSVLDLDDLGHALHLGLIGQEQAISILHDTQALVHSILNGDFPPPEVRAYLVQQEAGCGA